MGFWKRLVSGSSRASDRAEKISAAELGQHLAELTSASTTPEFLDMLVEGLEGVGRDHALFALAVLDLFSWVRVTQSEVVDLDRAYEQEVYDSFASLLIVNYVQRFGSTTDPDALVQSLTRRVQALMAVWNASQDQEPSPHWYVAKAVWFMLQRDLSRPDPTRITALEGILATYENTQAGFVKEMKPHLGTMGAS